MLQLIQFTVLLLVVHSAVSATLNVVSIPGNGICPLQEQKDAAIQNIRAYVQTVIQDHNNVNCGAGEWYRVAYLNMSNSSQQCPSAWREYSDRWSGVRGCGRPETLSGSCQANFYPTSRQYNRVCGRVIGYQIGGTAGFGGFGIGEGIDSYYVYGVSVTHGTPRNHIWTLASGVSEGDYIHKQNNCP